MPDFVDLHIHSNHSDGRQSPRQVIDDALELGLQITQLRAWLASAPKEVPRKLADEERSHASMANSARKQQMFDL